MAGHFVDITQYQAPICYIAWGTYTQPADDNVEAHIDCGFCPRLVFTASDLGATEQGAWHMPLFTAGSSVNIIDGTVITSAVTLRDNWTVTTGEYYIRNGESNLSTADAEVDKINGFTMSTNINATDNDIIFWVALG